MQNKIILALIPLTIVLFIVGSVPAIGAVLGDIYFGYMVWVVTCPAWVLSAVFAIVLGILGNSKTLMKHEVSKFGWAMLLLNIVSAVIIWNLPW